VHIRKKKWGLTSDEVVEVLDIVVAPVQHTRGVSDVVDSDL